MQTKTLIVGGGLSGLALADRLHREKSDFLLVEASDGFGGRIKSTTIGGAAFDLGPAWFWPGQPRLQSLIDRFELKVFEQHSEGESLIETADGRVLRGRGYASMQGSLRLAGGLGSLITALVNELPENKCHLSASVTALTHTNGEVSADTAIGSISARHVVITAPPRVAADSISFSPALPAGANQALQNIPTWMAGHAKFLAVYDTPFWRQNGLSGDAMSQRGPLVEIHDASAAENGGFALFGFIGVPADSRSKLGQSLKQMAVDQLVRLFGQQAEHPTELILEDWAQNCLISTSADHINVGVHPVYGRSPALTGLWQGALSFASTETADDFGGFMEGALEAGENLALP